MSDKNKEMIGILNKHSGLTTYHIVKGDSLSANAQKIIWKIFQNEQEILKNNFSIKFKEYIGKIFYEATEKEIELILDNIYSNNPINLDNFKIDHEMLGYILKEIVDVRLERIKKLPKNDDSTIKHILDFNGTYSANMIKKINNDLDNKLLEFISNDEETLKKVKNKKISVPSSVSSITSKDIINVVEDIKDFCKEEAVNISSVDRFLDLTKLCTSINYNVTRLKKELQEAGQTQLKLNYINKKRLNIDLQSSLISSVTFETSENKKQIWLKYEIPRRILELLLYPEMYVPIDGITIAELKTGNSILLYEFLKDHSKRGYVSLTKEELFGFIKSSKKCMTNKYELEQRILIPSISEINSFTDINVSYNFNAQKKWSEIEFIIKRNEGDVLSTKMDLDFSEPNIKKKVNYKDDIDLLKAVEKAKRNIYVSRAWKKDGDRKVNQVLKSKGKEFTIMILKELYSSLKTDIEITITAYINGIIKNKNTEKKEIVKQEKKKLTKKSKSEKEKVELIVKPIEEQKKENVESEVIEPEIIESRTYKTDVKLLDDLIDEITEDEKNGFKTFEKRAINVEIFYELIDRYQEREMNMPFSFISLKKFIIR